LAVLYSSALEAYFYGLTALELVLIGCRVVAFIDEERFDYC